MIAVRSVYPVYLTAYCVQIVSVLSIIVEGSYVFNFEHHIQSIIYIHKLTHSILFVLYLSATSLRYCFTLFLLP